MMPLESTQSRTKRVSVRPLKHLYQILGKKTIALKILQNPSKKDDSPENPDCDPVKTLLKVLNSNHSGNPEP